MVRDANGDRIKDEDQEMDDAEEEETMEVRLVPGDVASCESFFWIFAVFEGNWLIFGNISGRNLSSAVGLYGFASGSGGGGRRG